MSELRIKIPCSRERSVRIFSADAPDVPRALFEKEPVPADLTDFPFPLPSGYGVYRCSVYDGGAWWYGSDTGLTRYEPDCPEIADRVQYFSAPRDLPDDEVRNLLPDGEGGVWVLTATGASHISMIGVSAFQKAEILRDETIRIVDRRGMVSQRGLKNDRDLSSPLDYNHSDNDGTFTCCFSMGELFRYECLKREYGADDERVKKAFDDCRRYVEACLLLMYIPGRGDGFPARTYLTVDEPVPDDGIYFRRGADGVAVCIDNSESRSMGLSGVRCSCAETIPARLAKLYRDLGYGDDEIIYKADTSSDEVTSHFMHIWFAHRLIGSLDPELDRLMISAASALAEHIVTHGEQLIDAGGRSTTWAKWDEAYFLTHLGWHDGCLNSAELLSYLKIMSDITDDAKWNGIYKSYLDRGYHKLTPLHAERLVMGSFYDGMEPWEDIMYGDHMLATMAHLPLCSIEKDPELLRYYRAGFTSWRGSIAREHNPFYDMAYCAAVPGGADRIDRRRMIYWFRRTPLTMFAAPCANDTRLDVAVETGRTGQRRISALLAPDERDITKYDRNPSSIDGRQDLRTVETCYPYTLAYWYGRFMGFIVDS